MADLAARQPGLRQTRAHTLGSQPAAGADVTPIVSTWASEKYTAACGFIVAGLPVPGPQPPVRQVCVMKFAAPSLEAVSF